MHRAHNKAVPEGLHGIGQNVPGHGLHQVLRDLWTIGFQPGPLPQVDALVGHALGAKAVHADAGLNIGEPSAGREFDKEHPALVVEPETAGFDRGLVHDRFLHSGIYVPPEAGNLRIRLTLGRDQRLKFLLGLPHLQSAHRL